MKDFWGKVLFLFCTFVILIALFYGAFEAKNWNSDKILFHDLKEITTNNNNRSFNDTVIVVGSFIYHNSTYVNDIKAHEVDIEDVYDNINEYIGDFIQFNGVFVEHIGTDVYNKFNVEKCRFITNKGMEVIVYAVKQNKKMIHLPEIKSYVLTKGTVIGENNINGKKTIEFVGIIQQ